MAPEGRGLGDQVAVTENSRVGMRAWEVGWLLRVVLGAERRCHELSLSHSGSKHHQGSRDFLRLC